MDTADTLAFDDGYGAPMSATFDEGATSDPERDALLRAKTLSLGSPWEDSDEERARQEILEENVMDADKIEGVMENNAEDKTEDMGNDEIAGIVEDNVENKTEDKGNDKIAGIVEDNADGKMEDKDEVEGDVENKDEYKMEADKEEEGDDEPIPASQPRHEPAETSGSAAPAKEELDDEKNKVPWVARDEQQNFKASRAAAQSKRPGGRGGGKGRGRGRGKKAKVQVEDEEEGSSSDDGTSRRNLEKEFRDVATSEEAHLGTDDEVSKPSAKTRRPKAKAKGKAKATPKKKARGPRKFKTPLKILKRPASKKSKTKGEDLNDGEAIGKCFAGRRPPATGQALVRFNIMLKVYNELIEPQVSTKKSSVQVGWVLRVKDVYL